MNTRFQLECFVNIFNDACLNLNMNVTLELVYLISTNSYWHRHFSKCRQSVTHCFVLCEGAILCALVTLPCRRNDLFWQRMPLGISYCVALALEMAISTSLPDNEYHGGRQPGKVI
jgi:hypothetical protein